eukprot:389123-Lingulodinium_polyedra.AAC.1
MPCKNRFRTPNLPFDVAALCDSLAEHARLKDCPYDFELIRYSKTKRSLGPDREGMIFYAPLLKKVLAACPTAFPPLAQLRSVWAYLDRKFSVRSQEHQHEDVVLWAEFCANNLRVCLRRMVDLKKSSSEYCCPDLQELLDMVQLSDPSDRPTSSASLSAGSGAPGPQQRARRVLSRESSCASSVEICAVHCQCPACQKPVDIGSSQG